MKDSKIIRFDSKQENICNFLREVLEKAENEEFDNIMISTKTKTGEVMNGYYNLGFNERQELISHCQLDIVWNMVRANLNID